MNVLFIIIAAFAVIAVSAVTIFVTPFDTTIPLPVPRETFKDNKNNTNSGVLLVAQNLEVPWAIDIAKDGRIFFTERMGRIRIIDAQGKLIDEPAANIRVEQTAEGGLLGLALHPNFTENHFLYVYYTYANKSKLYNKVLMLREKENKIIESKVVIDSIPGAQVHDGGRIKFGPDGKLYISTGDATIPELAQNTKSLAGKILRLNSDGTIPNDNPFLGSPVYSYGHRNVQGMAWHSKTKQLYATEHGSSGNDEINIIKAGSNYGWPLEECKGSGQFEASEFCFNPAIAPTGVTIPTNDKLGYQNDLIFTTLKGSHLRDIDLKSRTQSNILVGYGRLRDVIEAHDGSLFVLTSNKDGRGITQTNDDKILRLLKPD
jgi:glucose/arabinose dehydrogenase